MWKYLIHLLQFTWYFSQILVFHESSGALLWFYRDGRRFSEGKWLKGHKASKEHCIPIHDFEIPNLVCFTMPHRNQGQNPPCTPNVWGKTLSFGLDQTNIWLAYTCITSLSQRFFFFLIAPSPCLKRQLLVSWNALIVWHQKLPPSSYPPCSIWSTMFSTGYFKLGSICCVRWASGYSLYTNKF